MLCKIANFYGGNIEKTAKYMKTKYTYNIYYTGLDPPYLLK